MKTKFKNKFKRMYLFVFLIIACFSVTAQESGYLVNRIKPGDICYRDTEGHEQFVDYRQWDQANPPGTALGVVFFSYYGTRPCGIEGVEKAWHGWIVSVDQNDTCIFAPVTSICYDTCVALYPVEGINTPYNPAELPSSLCVADTCGWQSTKRLLEFIYTGCGAVLSDETLPALRYIFSEKNGINDFSQKPPMTADSWYLMGYGQLRILYGYLGPVNAAMAACGGALFSVETWYTSTEVSYRYPKSVWSYGHDGTNCTTAGWFKDKGRVVRAVRSF